MAARLRQGWFSGLLAAPNQMAWALTLALGWLWTWWRLSFEWRANEQYQYAYAVPPLALYLAARSWRPDWFSRHPQTRWGPLLVFCAIVFAWLIFTLGELVWQQDPAWRLSVWLMMLSVTLWTVAWLWQIGGWPTTRVMVFPIAFSWLALPWPSFIESWVIRDFLEFLTALTTDVLNWSGIAALQRGAIIELKNGVVGIEIACSGVQSFQASLMATMFLGAFFSLPLLRRGILVVCGLLFALAGNFCRIFWLSWLVSKHGMSAVDRYHDRIGALITFSTFAGLALLATCLTWRSERNLKNLRETALKPKLPQSGFHGFVSLGLLLCVPALVSAWFALITPGQTEPQVTPLWQLETSSRGAEWQTEKVEVTRDERAVLRFSEGSALRAQNSLGYVAYLYHFFWKPGARVSSAVFAHTPNICLPSLGWKQVGKPSPALFSINGKPTRATLYRFEQDGAEQLVGQTISPEPFFEEGFPVFDRRTHFSLLWRAPRQRVHEVVLIYCTHTSGRPTPSTVLEKLFAEFVSERGK